MKRQDLVNIGHFLSKILRSCHRSLLLEFLQATWSTYHFCKKGLHPNHRIVWVYLLESLSSSYYYYYSNFVSTFAIPQSLQLSRMFFLAPWTSATLGATTSHRTLFTSFSNNFSFRDSNGKIGNGSISCSSSHNWLTFRVGRTDLLKQDHTLLWHHRSCTKLKPVAIIRWI